MSNHSELYIAARTALQGAQEAYRLARRNLRKQDPVNFKLITTGERVSRRTRSPQTRSKSWHERREAIERGVLNHWSLNSPEDYEACIEECCRIGEILREAGLFAKGSYTGSTLSRIAIANNLMNPWVSKLNLSQAS